MDIPPQPAELCSISPVVVKATPAYEAFRLALVEFACKLSIVRADSERSYGELSRKLAEIKELKRELADSRDLALKELVSAETDIEGMFLRLEQPINEAIASLTHETRNYHEQMERQRAEFEANLRQQTEKEQAKRQRKADLEALRKQLYGARQIADHSELSGQLETAREIRTAIQRYANLDVSPDAYPKPLESVQEIRRIVANAFAHEQERAK